MTTSLQPAARLQPSSRSCDLQADLQSEEGQRQIAEDALATANADLQFANDNLFAAQSEIAAKQQKLADLQADLQSEEGQRQIAEDALATANADLQFANDNLFAAQSEIAAKQQKLADLQADLQSEEGQRQIAEDALATATLICNSRMTTSCSSK